MGRLSTGAWTTYDARELSLSYLQKSGLIIKGSVTQCIIDWKRHGEPNGSIGITVDYTGRPFMQLKYTITAEGIKTDYDYKVLLYEAPTGFNPDRIRLYFICPESGKKCLKLYKAYGYPKWKSRPAYRNRLYYPLQLASKLDRANSRYWNLEDKLKEDKKKRKASHYNGKPTKRYQRIQRIKEKQKEADFIRYLPCSMPLQLRRLVWDEET